MDTHSVKWLIKSKRWFNSNCGRSK